MSDVPHTGDEPPERYEFSLVVGGPLYRLLMRARLSGPSLQFLRRRTVAILTIVWLPLLLLTMLEGHARGGVAVPFLEDIAAQARLLISLPLLIAAEKIVHRKMRATIPLFAESGMLEGAQHEQFANAIASARRWLDSVPAELALLALVYAVALTGTFPKLTTLAGDTWHGTFREGHQVFTLAGWWAAIVSVPLFQFLLLRWYFRLLVWWRFLWQVARIEPKLQPLHPDQMGGIGFLSRLSNAFVPLLLAQAALASGVIADQILYAGATLTDFRLEIGASCIVLLILVIGPLFAFTPNLARAKHAGLLKHEALAMGYARKFDRKWLSGTVPDEPLLGNADVQTLADMGNSYEVVRAMRMVPIDKLTLVQLLAAALVPMLPLLLTKFSFKELVSQLLTVIL